MQEDRDPMSPPMMLFTMVTLAPVGLIAAAALPGGTWSLLAPAYMTALAAGLDRFTRAPLAETEPGREFPAAEPLSVLLALSHFGLLGLGIWALTGGTGLQTGEKIGLFIATGLFLGQVSNSNAHELIHRPARGLRRLGVAVYSSVLFGHHASAHPLVHHVHVATRRDPNSARMGEGFYRYWWRAWRGSFREGWRAETARRARSDGAAGPHPYAIYLGGAVLSLALAAALGGPGGVLALLALAGFAQTQLLMSDYVQHYGLSRSLRPDGRPEPVGDRHSWNAPHWFTSALMLNAPRHSAHHAHPARPYPALTLPAPDAAPTLPHSLPVMACIALWPRLWRRVMDPRARLWLPRPMAEG